jgi:uncharacterized protein (UPF0332 family)
VANDGAGDEAADRRSHDHDIHDGAVEREFERAEQMLADARTAREVDISTATVVNRLSYACFHAAQAALYAHGFDPQSHGGVQTLLGRELITTGDVAREHGRVLSDMDTYQLLQIRFLYSVCGVIFSCRFSRHT